MNKHRTKEELREEWLEISDAIQAAIAHIGDARMAGETKGVPVLAAYSASRLLEGALDRFRAIMPNPDTWEFHKVPPMAPFDVMYPVQLLVWGWHEVIEGLDWPDFAAWPEAMARVERSLGEL